jgi:hypothetical protein
LINTAGITALSLTITVQNTGGISFAGQYNTVGGSITQTHSGTASAVTFQFSLAAGQTLPPGTNWLFDAQTGGAGISHLTSGDTFALSYRSQGTPFALTGHF